MTRTLFKPARPLKRGTIVTVEIAPYHTLQSEIVGFFGIDLLLDGWPEPINRETVKS